VLLFAPVLLIVGRVRSRGAATSRGVGFAWFVFWFGAVIVAQSLAPLPSIARAHLIDLDTVLLANAMFALGVATRRQQLKQAGTRPLLLAAIIFAALVTGGWAMTRSLL
jgi:uncharacterized membrane protein YadS